MSDRWPHYGERARAKAANGCGVAGWHDSCVCIFGMTKPMPVLPHTTYLESRRCSERRFFLRPSKAAKQIYTYCLAVAAERFGIEVHGYCVESNHEHLITTDTRGNHPAFRQLKNSLIGRAMNVHLGRREAFWAPTDRDVTELVDEGAQVNAYAYTLANPVKDGLVKYGDQWPGPRSHPEHFGKERIIKRPKGLFRDGRLPRQITLTLTPPPALSHVPLELASTQLREAVRTAECGYRKAREAKGLPFLGRRTVRKQSPFDRPKRPAAFRRLNPRIKCADADLRRTALAQLKSFWTAYADARQLSLVGKRRVCFPAGTYQLRLLAGVPCAPG